MPIWLHAILQSLLAGIFAELGYFSGSELDLRISPDFQPRPDVAASLELESTSYPAKPVDIVAEVLSPDDDLQKLCDKCENYAAIGIRQIYPFDPVERWAAPWSPLTGSLERLTELRLTNGIPLTVESIFLRFDARLKRR